MASGGYLLDIGRFVADVNKAERVQEFIAFCNDQNVIAAGEESNSLSRLRLRGVAEKFRGNL